MWIRAMWPISSSSPFRSTKNLARNIIEKLQTHTRNTLKHSSMWASTNHLMWRAWKDLWTMRSAKSTFFKTTSNLCKTDLWARSPISVPLSINFTSTTRLMWTVSPVWKSTSFLTTPHLLASLAECISRWTIAHASSKNLQWTCLSRLTSTMWTASTFTKNLKKRPMALDWKPWTIWWWNLRWLVRNFLPDVALIIAITILMRLPI